jgi:hypothetical protein
MGVPGGQSVKASCDSCLVRVLVEELGFQVSVDPLPTGDKKTTTTLPFDHLLPVRLSIRSGVLTLNGACAYLAAADELASLDWAEADLPG